MDEISKPIGAPSDWEAMSDWEKLCLLPTKVQEYYLLQLIDEGIDFEHLPLELILRPKQKSILDSQEWIILYSAGRGAGKSKTGAAWVIKKAKEDPGCIIHLVGRTAADVRDVMVSGEALAVDTLIPTPSGMKTMEDISAGDYVYGSNGETTRVLWVSPIHYNRPCYEVKFKDGASVVCDENHKWYTSTRISRRSTTNITSSVKTTIDILKTLKCENNVFNHQIDLIKPIKGEEVNLPVPAYTLGIWLGDGMSRDGAIATMDSEIISGIEKDGFKVSPHKYNISYGKANHYGVIGLETKLRSANLLLNKHIPDIYYTSSYSQRLELVQGLIDSDGCCTTGGHISFTNSNTKLILGLQRILSSMGIKSNYSKINRKEKDYHKDLYTLRFSTIAPVATVARKLNNIRVNLNNQVYTRTIKYVDSIESVPVKCIAVESEDQLYAVGSTYILTHNSGIINSSPLDFMPIYTPSLRKLIWPNGSSALTFSSEKSDQLRGPQAGYAWCDELASYSTKPDASGSTTWDQVIMSTRLGARPQILASTTPRRTPLIKNLLKDAERTIETGVQLVTGSTLDNRANLSEDYIKMIYDRYAGTHLEKQELHGELSGDAEGALFRTEDFHFAGVSSDNDLLTVIGVDPSVGSGAGDSCGIIIACAENLGWNEVNRRKAWILEDLTAQMSPDEWARVIIDAHRRYPNSVAALESNQGVELLRLVIHQIDPTIPIALVHSKMNKAQRAEPVVMAFRQRRVFLVDQFQDLIDECTSWIPNQSSWSPGRIDAMSVALGTLLVDPRPLYPYLPATSYKPRDDELTLDVVPSWRQYHSTHSGLALPPWRR